jgi:hypothetical protein
MLEILDLKGEAVENQPTPLKSREMRHSRPYRWGKQRRKVTWVEVRLHA